MATLVPSSFTSFDRTTYLDTIEDPTFQEILFIDSIKPYGKRILDTGTVQKYARVLGTALAQSDTGATLTTSNPGGTAVVLTPAGNYVALAWSANGEAQIDVDLRDGGKTLLEKGLAETLDQNGLAAVTSLTQSISGAAVDADMWYQANGRLMQNSNGEIMPGKSMIKAIFSPTQYPNLMKIDVFTHADIRGGGDAHEKGIFTKGGGVNVRFSTVVTQDANGWHQPLYVAEAFIHGWNQRIKGYFEQENLEFRVNVYANDATSVLHDARAIDIRSTASAL